MEDVYAECQWRLFIHTGEFENFYNEGEQRMWLRGGGGAGGVCAPSSAYHVSNFLLSEEL